MSPLLSIIMPVKNGTRYLSECLDSIIEQSCLDWELIIIDDHSTDETKGLLNKFSTRDKRISHYPNSGNGIVAALDLALSKANGGMISRMDSDDIMPHDRLKLMVNKLQHSPPKTVVTGLVKYFSDQPISDGYLKYESWLNEINLREYSMEKKLSRMRNRFTKLDGSQGGFT